MVIDVGNRKGLFRGAIDSTPIFRPKVMHVRVELSTALAKYVPSTRPGVPFISEIPDGSTLSDLMMYLQVPETEVSLSFVNGLHRSGEFQLKNDDVVFMFPLVGK